MSVRNDKNGKLLRPLADSIMTFITTWFPGRLQHVMIVCAHCIANQSYDPFVFDLDACESAAGTLQKIHKNQPINVLNSSRQAIRNVPRCPSSAH